LLRWRTPSRHIAGWSGKEMIMSKAAVVKLYMHLTGGLDSGLVELDVLNYWRKHAVSGDEILAFVSIDPKNHTHVEQAIKLFGGVYLGFQVQQNCIQEFDARQSWTPGPLTNDGHAVFAVGYDHKGVTVLTWGNTQQPPGPGGMSASTKPTQSCRRKRRILEFAPASTSRNCKPTWLRWRVDSQTACSGLAHD